MSFIIGLSGTHGTGKSTILQYVKDCGYAVDQTQISREAQKELGWESLNVDSVEKMWDLQEAVLGAMFDRDQRITRSKTLTLVERTPADAMAYTALWAQKLGVENTPQLISYRNRAYVMAYNYRKFLLVPQTAEVPFVAEARRATIESREFVDQQIRKFFSDVEGLPVHEIVSIRRGLRGAEACMQMAIEQSLLRGD